jgi:hypothetical protein
VIKRFAYICFDSVFFFYESQWKILRRGIIVHETTIRQKFEIVEQVILA